jgi:hypothetical protein
LPDKLSILKAHGASASLCLGEIEVLFLARIFVNLRAWKQVRIFFVSHGHWERNSGRAIPIKGACIRTQEKLQTNTEGSVMVEYTVLLVAAAIGISASIYAIGVPLVERYQFMKLLIGLPLP